MPRAWAALHLADIVHDCCFGSNRHPGCRNTGWCEVVWSDPSSSNARDCFYSDYCNRTLCKELRRAANTCHQRKVYSVKLLDTYIKTDAKILDLSLL